MEKRPIFLLIFLISMCILFLFSCPLFPPDEPDPTATPTPAPTFTPAPTSTPVPAGTQIPTPTPVPTPSPVITPTPSPSPAPRVQFYTPCRGYFIDADRTEHLSAMEKSLVQLEVEGKMQDPSWGIIELIEVAGTYNCHGYTWTYNFGMPKCQIDKPETGKFISDGSFTEIQESEVQSYLNNGYKVVVRYKGVDHSTVIEGPDQSIWTAKMGRMGALVKHYKGAKFDSYYNRAVENGGFTYYVLSSYCGFVPVETLAIPADGSTVYSLNQYTSAFGYKIVVSGTFTWGGCDPVTCPDGGGCDYERYADAEWLTDDCRFITVFADFYTWDISLFINGQNIDWGPYTDTHYYSTIIQGNNNAFSFRIEDCPDCYGDNSGELTVTIFAPS